MEQIKNIRLKNLFVLIYLFAKPVSGLAFYLKKKNHIFPQNKILLLPAYRYLLAYFLCYFYDKYQKINHLFNNILSQKTLS